MPTVTRALRSALVGATWRAATLTAGGLTAAFGYNAVREDGLSLWHYEPAASCSGTEAVRPEVGVVSPQALAEECGNRDVVVADARSAERFAMGHIAGAVHLPCSASDDAARVVDSLLRGKRDLVVYGETEAEARPVAEALARRTEPELRVRVLQGGFQGWANQGLACASGGCPWPEPEQR
jgi:3-mercaptopyruvate sulfurtransferase SseA